MRTKLDVVLSSSSYASLFAHLTTKCADLQITSTSPGGYAGGTLTFDQPITSDFLTQFDTVSVYDAGGTQCGGGRLTDPGRTADANGEVWQIAFIGEGPAHMLDTTGPYILLETSFDGFYVKGRTTLAGTTSVGPTPDNTSSDDAVTLGAPGGAVLSNGIVAAMFYDRLAQAGFLLGGYRFTRIAGVTAAGYQVESALIALSGSPATTTQTSTNFNVAAGTIAAQVVNTDFTSGFDILRLTMRRSAGAITVADDTTWCSYYNLHVAAKRYAASGSFVTNSDHANPYVLSSDVVNDLLGRRLSRFDGANASVTTTSYQIDELSYPDSVTSAQVMDDLLQMDRAMTWHVWEVNPATGKYVFEFVPWSTGVRYDASVIDGFTSPSPTTDLYNAVNVRYKSKSGLTRTLNVTGGATLGYTRTGFIDMADEVGSAANAARAGAQWLLDHTYPPNTGTLTIARPILDLTYGQMVNPWAIRPGNLIKVRGVKPYPDSLNASDKDGVTVFRIKSVTYSDSDGAATLELDTYSRTEDRAIADLQNRRIRKR